MGITRKSKFGFPVRQPPGSVETTRLVPLTQGIQAGTAWPLLPPGSSVSMTNFLALDGALVPRSRLSSLNTVRTLATPIVGMAECPSANAGAPRLWVSGTTLHGVLNMDAVAAPISRASFTSAFGLGTHSGVGAGFWNYAVAYFPNTGENALVAAMGPSGEQLHVLYETGTGTQILRDSYLTGAPKPYYVASYDNYVIGFNLAIPGGIRATQRAQWCVRGDPSAWTAEGSGFEDLLAARGAGTGIKVLGNQLVLFTEFEIWMGQTATYPAQFQFVPLDPNMGCPFPRTIIATEAGLLFIGTDFALRLLPNGGGVSQVLSAPIAKLLRYDLGTQTAITETWATFDPLTGVYHLFYGKQDTVGSAYPTQALVFHLDSGVWGRSSYTVVPNCGVAAPRLTLSSQTRAEGLFFGSSNGTVYSTNSLLANENGSPVVATWRSAPIAPDLPGNYKQVTKIALDYRATSKSTVTIKLSQDGGNNYEATGKVMSLGSAPYGNRIEMDVYAGGAFPALELTSQSTGYELHRIDVAMNLGGRK